MPLPSWSPDGRHTSVWGGTMLGISKTTKDPDTAWTFARQYLYFDDSVARKLYDSNGIISPVKRLWKSDFYDQPEPYFSNQAPGRLYIEHAPRIPRRTSSPYNMHRQRTACPKPPSSPSASYALRRSQNLPDPTQLLMPEAHNQLRLAQGPDAVTRPRTATSSSNPPAPVGGQLRHGHPHRRVTARQGRAH